jgi:hypothetical protein
MMARWRNEECKNKENRQPLQEFRKPTISSAEEAGKYSKGKIQAIGGP